MHLRRLLCALALRVGARFEGAVQPSHSSTASSLNPAQSWIVEVNSGSGGQEAESFAAMLIRALLRLCAKQGVSCDIEEEHPTPSGFKSVVLRVEGPLGEKIARFESGVHRLIRASPFGDGRAQTSFAALSARLLEDTPPTSLNLNEVKIWATTSQGPGGQHVNKTQSAIWAKHLPTGIAVCAQSRSQKNSKQLALARLAQKLEDLESNRQAQAARGRRQERGEAGFGQSFRVYRLQGDLAKDERTGKSCSAKLALDGRLDALWS